MRARQLLTLVGLLVTAGCATSYQPPAPAPYLEPVQVRSVMQGPVTVAEWRAAPRVAAFEREITTDSGRHFRETCKDIPRYQGLFCLQAFQIPSYGGAEPAFVHTTRRHYNSGAMVDVYVVPFDAVPLPPRAGQRYGQPHYGSGNYRRQPVRYPSGGSYDSRRGSGEIRRGRETNIEVEWDKRGGFEVEVDVGGFVEELLRF